MLAAQRHVTLISASSSASQQCFGALESSCGQWVDSSRSAVMVCRRGRPWAHGRPFGTELTSVYALSASTDRAQSTVLVSITSVDGAGSSTMGGDVGVPYSQLVLLILARLLTCKVTFFTRSVDHKGGWESTQRSHHTD